MKQILYFLIFIFCFTTCKPDAKLEQEIAKINSDIQVERFDRIFADSDASNLSNLKKAYPFMFSERYSDDFWKSKMIDTFQIQLEDEVKNIFPDFTNNELEIESLINHLKYYFPEFLPPRFITTTSFVDYRNRVVLTDTIAIVSIDTYLGSEHEFYENIPRFIAFNLKKEQITTDLATQYAEKYIFQKSRKTLLDEMIYYGKQLYFKDIIIPFKTEAERINYSEDQLAWAKANENYIWRFFVEKELLFSTDSKLPNRFINPAPFSKFYLEEIDTDSPGRLGQYIGWQIVRAYMQQNEVSLRDMLIASPEEIFNNAKFKPRKGNN